MKFDAPARITLLILGLALAACGGTDPGTGGTPDGGTDGAEPSASDSTPGEAAPPSASLPTFRAPEGWTEVTPVPPRKHEFHLEGADGAIELLVFAWPTAVGGLELNVARWAGERAGQLTEDERKQFEAGPYLVTTVFLEDVAAGDDAHGTSVGAMFNAYIELPGASPVWTVKATGPTEAMLAQRATLEAFVQNL